MSGEIDRVELSVGEPGRFQTYVRRVVIAQAGARLTLDSEEAIAFRLLPGLDQPFRALVDATASYRHLCAEQTAAKLLALAVKYLGAHQRHDVHEQRATEERLTVGLARIGHMHREGLGFTMYAGRHEEVDTFYSPVIVRYLWTLQPLLELREVPPELAAAIYRAVAMADDVARRFELARLPTRIASIEDAYAVAAAKQPGQETSVLAFVDLFLRELEAQGGDPVFVRRATAYAAAALLALGELGRGVQLANQVLRAMNAAGRLYSTIDSVAAIALFTQLARAGIGASQGEVRANGRVMSALDGAALVEEIESIDVLEGVALVEVTAIQQDDWTALGGDVAVEVAFLKDGKRVESYFRVHDEVELEVSVPGGYQVGDVLHVCLPPGLAWVHGGAQVKAFSVDFAGEERVRVPLVVTRQDKGREHFAVCVRNMFQERRSGFPGVLEVDFANVR